MCVCDKHGVVSEEIYMATTWHTPPGNEQLQTTLLSAGFGGKTVSLHSVILRFQPFLPSCVATSSRASTAWIKIKSQPVVLQILARKCLKKTQNSAEKSLHDAITSMVTELKFDENDAVRVLQIKTVRNFPIWTKLKI